MKLVVGLILVVFVLAIAHARKRRPTIHAPQYPKTIYLTYKTKDGIPGAVIRRLQVLHPEFEISVYGNEECSEFLRTRFGDEHAAFFDDIPDGPIKADFWRVCIIYANGGVYLDADVDIHVPLTKFIDPNVDFCTSGSMNHGHANPILIVAKPACPILKRCIDMFLEKRLEPYSYWGYSICPIMEAALQEEIGSTYKSNESAIYPVTQRSGLRVQLIREEPWHSMSTAHTTWKGRRVLNNHSPTIYKGHAFVE